MTSRTEPPDEDAGFLTSGLRLVDTPENRHFVERLMACAGLGDGEHWRALTDAVKETLPMYRSLKARPPVRPDAVPSAAAAPAAAPSMEHLRVPAARLRQGLEQLDGDLLEVIGRAVDLRTLAHQLALLERVLPTIERETGQPRAEDHHVPPESEAVAAVLDLLAKAFQLHEAGSRDDYQTRVRDFLVYACYLGDVPLPAPDRILDLLPPSLRGPRGAHS